jgi:Zn-dependent protease with chaperone function
MNVSRVLPRLVLFGILLNFLVRFIVHVVEISHLSKAPVSFFRGPDDYVTHQFDLERLRYSTAVLVFSTVFDCLLLAAMGHLWRLTNSNISFILVMVLGESLVVTLPSAIIRECFVFAKFGRSGTFSAALIATFGAMFSSAINILFLVFVFYLASRCTKLEPEDGEAATGGCRVEFWMVVAGIFIAGTLTSELTTTAAYIAEAGPDNFTSFSIAGLNDSTQLEVMRLVRSVSFPYEAVYVQATDGQPNAVFIGITDQRIIVMKSLLPLVRPRELCAVIAHELSHWKHGDLIVLAVCAMIVTLIHAFFCFVATKTELTGFGIQRGKKPVIVIIIIVMFLAQGITLFELPLTNALQRRFEARADCWAAALGYPIGDALIAIETAMPRDIEPSRPYEMFYISHPPISSRLQNINKCFLK